MQVTILGSGGALPTPRRASSGYLVEWDGHALLLDAAAGTYVAALRAGLDPNRLRAVALSHFHLDHTGDLAGILWARKQSPELKETPLRLLGPDGTRGFVECVVAAYPADWLEVAWDVGGYPAEVDGLSLEAFPARHSPEAVCLRLRANGRTLAYSGDTADCDGLRQACRGADLALLECSKEVPSENHLDPDACAAVIEAARPGRALLTHLSPAIETSLPKAEDGMVISV